MPFFTQEYNTNQYYINMRCCCSWTTALTQPNSLSRYTNEKHFLHFLNCILAVVFNVFWNYNSVAT